MVRCDTGIFCVGRWADSEAAAAGCALALVFITDCVCRLRAETGVAGVPVVGVGSEGAGTDSATGPSMGGRRVRPAVVTNDDFSGSTPMRMADWAITASENLSACSGN